MTEADSDPEFCVNLVIKEYNEGNVKKAIEKAQDLQVDIAKLCQEQNGYNFSKDFYESMVSVVKNIDLFSQKDCVSLIRDLSFIKCIVGIIRNSFYKNSLNQQMVGENESLRGSLDSLLKALTGSIYTNVKEMSKQQNFLIEKDSSDTLEMVFYDTLSICITTFVNMMAGNSYMREVNWPFLQSVILNLLSFPTPKVSHSGAALLHQFLLEDNIKTKIVNNEYGEEIFGLLLRSYLRKGPHACFSLFCLELLLESKKICDNLWESLTDEETLLLLDILSSLIHKEKFVNKEVASFIKEKFKREADKIFRIHDGRKTSLEPNVITRMANFLCSVASSDNFRETLQRDKSLLISTVYLLKGITDIGNNSENAFTRVSDTDTSQDEENHPAFGFKSDLIRLIAAITYRNRQNQDLVREIDGLLLLLENSQFDARNPLIREAAIFALRNLLEGNYENQKVISELKLEGVAQNKVLDELGMSATLEGGKISLHQK